MQSVARVTLRLKRGLKHGAPPRKRPFSPLSTFCQLSESQSRCSIQPGGAWNQKGRWHEHGSGERIMSTRSWSCRKKSIASKIVKTRLELATRTSVTGTLAVTSEGAYLRETPNGQRKFDCRRIWFALHSNRVMGSMRTLVPSLSCGSERTLLSTSKTCESVICDPINHGL